MFNWILNKIAGNYNERQIKKLWPIVEKINEIDKKRDKLSDEDIKSKTFEFKERLKKGETLDDILPEAFATVKQACKRLLGKKFLVKGHEYTWDMVPYDVQLLGGIVLHQGKIAEMKTGEGKTLVATLPAYLNALEGKGVHIVTVNDYLASRDAEWMGYLYNWLGLSVGSITKNTPIARRRQEYEKDITYVENSELGFDYLRDNLAKSIEERVLLRRPLNYAIIDEADSILIDEARTPLIISAPSEEPTEKYKYYAQIVKLLKPCKGKPKKAGNLLKKLLEEETNQENEECDYYIDEKTKTTTLTSRGIKKLEEIIKVKNLYKDLGYEEIHHIENALKALACYHKDKDYIVKDGEILIVDENTGRIMPGRRYSEGLHQAIEAKEGVEIQRESKTLATITYQHFFKQYKKLAGMTGTAATEGEEFEKIYGLEVIVIPTNKPVIRVDKPDNIFLHQKDKWQAVVETVRFYHNIGVPILIGTSSIQTSEYVSSLLRKMGIPHYVLNAKYHEQEAEIVANAGKLGSVVVATNMAGRGTDIKLQPGLLEKLAENYINRIEKTIKGDNFNKTSPKAISANVYSEKEFNLTIEELKKKFNLSDEDISNSNKEEICKNGICLKININSKKKSKDEPYAEIIIKPQNVEKPEIIEKDLHYGLFILGTEKHESRRIDNQLRGRAGRQGDPGVSVFYVSLEDELLRKMGGMQMQSMILFAKNFAGDTVEEVLKDKKLSSIVERAQKQMEAWNYSIRKHLYDYDTVIDKQRQRIYKKRDEILTGKIDIIKEIESFIPNIVEKLVDTYTSVYPRRLRELNETLAEITGEKLQIDELEKFKSKENLKNYLKLKLNEILNKKLDSIFSNSESEGISEEDKENLSKLLYNLIKNIYLGVIDKNWIDHIDNMTYLRDKVSLYGYAQQDPLVMYKKEAFEKFQNLLFNIQKETLSRVLRTNFSFLKEKLKENKENQITPLITNDEEKNNEILNKLQQSAEKAKDIKPEEVIIHTEKSENNKNITSEDDDIEVIELSPQEENDGIQVIENLLNNDNITKKTPRPYDPCPCGSGKPYIKCCGRKK